MKAGDILRRAKELVAGDRQTTYGDKAERQARVAVLWNAWLEARREPGSPLNGEDVAHMMALLKMASTQGGGGTVDNYVDAAGWESIAGELSERAGG